MKSVEVLDNLAEYLQQRKNRELLNYPNIYSLLTTKCNQLLLYRSKPDNYNWNCVQEHRVLYVPKGRGSRYLDPNKWVLQLSFRVI